MTGGEAVVTPTGTSSRLDAWERHETTVYRLIPHFAMAVSVLLSLAIERGTTLYVVLGFSLVTTGWVTWWITLHPQWESRQRLMAVYFVGLMALTAPLVSLAPLYGFFAFTGYLHSFLVLKGRWRIVGVCATAMLSATSQSGGFPTGKGLVALWAVLFVFNAAIANVMSWFGSLTQEQNQRRKKVIGELAESNRQLTQALEENAWLHGQLVTQAREAGVMEERQRMAREIHDTLAQGLTGIITQVQAAEQAAADPAEWRRHLDTAARLARESLTEARRSVHAIRPEPLETAQLPEALAEVVQRWSTVNSVRAEVVTTGTPRPLHPEVEVTLLRTAQEALANVAKHARASRVGLTLSYMEDLVTLDVRDDGVGFEPPAADRAPTTVTATPTPALATASVTDRAEAAERTELPAGAGAGASAATDGGLSVGVVGGSAVVAGVAEPPEGGFGLIAMRQRVHRLAGRLSIESEPGVGTAISACVPAIAAAGAE